MGKIEIVLCSDNHGFRQPLEYLKQTYPADDYFLHCGDTEMHPYEMEGFAVVQGNNDFFNAYPKQRIIQIGEHQILMVHGHMDLFLNHYDMLAKKAKNLGCDIACFGHTHIYHDSVINGVRMLNPGSIWRNRDGSDPSYMLIHLDGKNIDVKRMTYKMKK